MWNLLGTGAPMLVAFIAIPSLIHGVGAARFGILSLAWMIVGYFGLFDFGLGRAVTQLVAQKIARREDSLIPPLVWTALTVMALLGVSGAALIAGISPWLVHRVLKIPAELQGETLTSFYLLALSIPCVISSTALRGVLEAYQRFDAVNIVRAPLGALMYLAPVAMLPYSRSLPSLVATLVVVRCISWVTYFCVCVKLYPQLRQPRNVDRTLLPRLLSFGGWITVSNVAGPLLLYLGRFLIAVLVSAKAVAYFSTPYDVVINLLIIPTVLVGVLFPAFSQLFDNDRDAVRMLYRKSMLQIFVTMLPLTVLTYLISKAGLSWWINQEFSENGFRVAQLLAIGIFVNSFGQLSQALVQAYGRPDITAKLHILELVTYVPYLCWLIGLYGINGAAIAWVARVSISTLALWFIANRCLCGSIRTRY